MNITYKLNNSDFGYYFKVFTGITFIYGLPVFLGIADWYTKKHDLMNLNDLVWDGIKLFGLAVIGIFGWGIKKEVKTIKYQLYIFGAAFILAFLSIKPATMSDDHDPIRGDFGYTEYANDYELTYEQKKEKAMTVFIATAISMFIGAAAYTITLESKKKSKTS